MSLGKGFEDMEKICPVCNHEVSLDDAVCPSCGFRLLEATQAMTPLRLDAEGKVQNPTSKGARHAALTVLKGPQTGIRIDLPDDSDDALIAGRNPECAVFLNDMTVSREHARFEKTLAGWRITDLKSFNGTWINNHNIASVLLGDGDIIQIGAFCLRFDC